ncbi:MAG: RNA methyltransferase [Lachnospiraceae bacterium]|nr:RNA methyltransferase [Lachnospiraceae bacterium]
MIESQSNSKIKTVSRLLNKKRDRYDSRTFVCEGKRIVSDIPRSAIKELYISESRADEVSALFIHSIPTEIVSDDVMRRLSDTRHPQGMLAVVRMPEYTWEDVTGVSAPGEAALQAASPEAKGRVRTEAPLLLILEDISDPGNLGTIFRVAEAAGVTGIILSKDTTDVFAPKVVRATMGSIFRMPFVVVDDVPEAIGHLCGQGIITYAATLGEKDLYAFVEGSFAGATAFVLGNEAHGVSERTAAVCNGAVTIPMVSSSLESLNVAMAAGILSYEALRQRREASVGGGGRLPASSDWVQRI